MLSVYAISSSAVASSYFEKDDYYVGSDTGGGSSGEGAEQALGGRWWGQGAAAMGLSGQVDKETFKDLLDGKMPDGQQLGTIREKDGEKVHKPGWDLTFSAPKSVSVLALVGDDERLRQAHDEAVKEAIGWAEKNLAGYRARHWTDKLMGLGDEAQHTKSGNLTVALFQHATSREKDPQLHTHAVVQNMTRTADGKWRSLNSKPLFDYKMALGAIYRNALASKVERLGYEIERDPLKGMFEVKGVPEDVRHAFSQRAHEIRASMIERGLESQKEAERAALMTRDKKSLTDKNTLDSEWKARVDELGYDPRATLQASKARPASAQVSDKLTADQAVQEAVARLADKESVFPQEDLLQHAVNGAIGRSSIADIEAAIQHQVKGGQLIETSFAGQAAYTTPAARHQEDKMIDLWRNSRGSVEAAYSSKDADRALSKTILNEGQRAGAKAILTQTDRFIGIEGRPGVGKTFTLGVIKPMLETKGYTLKGMAGNAKAARTIQDDAKIASQTLQRHLYEARKDMVALQSGNPLKRRAVLQRTEKEIWFIDEASQIGAGDMSRLMQFAEKLKVRVVNIGDTRQLAAINSGKPFEQLMKNGMQRTEIDENVRQTKRHHKKAVKQGVSGNIRGAMNTLAKETVEISDAGERLQYIVDQWGSLTKEARAKTTILTARNAERILLNDGLRDVMRAEGQLKGEERVTALKKVYAERMDKVNAGYYSKNDLVVFGKVAAQSGLEKNTYYRVAATDVETNLVTLVKAEGDERAEIAWNPRSIAGRARVGPTIYKERETTLAPGEKIEWGRNTADLKLSNDQPLNNGMKLTVEKIGKDGMTLTHENGSTITLDSKELRSGHWDHAYAITTYRGQGLTDSTVIVNAESNRQELFNQKAFVVAESRHKDRLLLVTDNTEKFTANVEKHKGDKSTVQESHKEHRAKEHAQAFRNLLDSFTPKSDDAQIAAEKAKTEQQERARSMGRGR